MSDLDTTNNEELAINNEQDADALLESIGEPENTDIQEKPIAAAPTPQEYSIKIDGREIKAPLDKILTWASQGYGAPNKIGELNKQIHEWKTKESQLNEIKERYGVVDEYVKTNPDWWSYVMSEYQKKQGQGVDASGAPVIQEIKQQVSEMKSYIDQLEKQKLEHKEQEDMKAYEGELETLKKQYKSIDFDTPDSEGKSLEWKILNHAQERGIKYLTTAFRDFYHDELMKIKEEEAKEKLAKDKTLKSKTGILGISSVPAKKTTESVKGKSYKDLEREALQELGIN